MQTPPEAPLLKGSHFVFGVQICLQRISINQKVIYRQWRFTVNKFVNAGQAGRFRYLLLNISPHTSCVNLMNAGGVKVDSY